jgi:hypothetical protein
MARLEAELAYWKAVAEDRGEAIGALLEFNYWHESTVARGEVNAGLEDSIASWRERCLDCEARQARRGPVHALVSRGSGRVIVRLRRLRSAS